jgi:hypothetical protein
MPHIPPVVLKVNLPLGNDTNTDIVNEMVQTLHTSKFQVQMFPSLNIDIYYIAIMMDQKELEDEARDMELRIKLVNVDQKRIFDPKQKGMFEPFRSKDIQ